MFVIFIIDDIEIIMDDEIGEVEEVTGNFDEALITFSGHSG